MLRFATVRVRERLGTASYENHPATHPQCRRRLPVPQVSHLHPDLAIGEPEGVGPVAGWLAQLRLSLVATAHLLLYPHSCPPVTASIRNATPDERGDDEGGGSGAPDGSDELRNGSARRRTAEASAAFRRCHDNASTGGAVRTLSRHLIPSAEDRCARLSSLDYRKRSPKRTGPFQPPSWNLRRSKEAFKTDSERLVACIAIPGNWYHEGHRNDGPYERSSVD